MTAQTACSRLEPQPKLRPTTRTVAPLTAGSFSGKSGSFRTVLLGLLGLGRAAGHVTLVGEEQGAEAGPLDLLQVAGRDDQVGVDVAPVEHGHAAAVSHERFHACSRVRRSRSEQSESVTGSRQTASSDVGEVAGDGGGGGHGRADQVGAAAGPLPALEVAVAGAGRALAGLELVGVHRQAHAAARLPPLGAGLEEDAVEPLGLGLMPDRLAAGHDQGLHAGRDLSARKTRAAARRSSIRPLVHEPMKTTSTGISRDRRAGRQPHVFEGAAGVLGRGERDIVRARERRR